MILFGPSGNSNIFYEQGHKSSMEMPPWLQELGLDAYEYSCTRGVRMGPESSIKLGEIAKAHGITMSVHAPYFINLASPDSEMIKKSEKYILDTVQAAEYMQADRVVIHVGSPSKSDRREAFERVYANFYEVLNKMKQIGHKAHLCPETMGKKNQIGSLDEIIELCTIDDSVIPTIDFGHLHAVTNGSLKTVEDFETVFDRLVFGLGERATKLHMHYTRIEYTEKGGERRHWTFDDVQYGPEFEHLAKCLVKYQIEGTVIAETMGTMAEDAVKLKGIYRKINSNCLCTMENI